MTKIINGKQLANQIKDDIVKDIVKLDGARPNLAIILVGEREDSRLYVSLKEKEAKKVGIDIHLYKCDNNVTEQEVLKIIDYLNRDELIDGILVQLPLPKGFDTDAIIMSIDIAKDVDGFHPDNLRKLLRSCDSTEITPPVFAVVFEILNSIDCKIKNKQACIIVNSEVFGKGLGHLLKCRGARVEIVKASDKILADKTKTADILISAVGKPRFIKKDMLKKEAVIIDIGITKVNGKVCGDADIEDVKNKVSYITPVPGGVGPLTIAMALKNTLELYKRRHEAGN